MSTQTLVPCVSIVGRSKSGKTTLIEKLIPELRRRGYRVGTLKHHAHPQFEMDYEGTDTWRHAQAGSAHVVLAAPDKLASIRQLDTDLEAAHIINTLMGDCDLVLTDGYRSAPLPKIEIVRAGRSTEPLCAPAELLAVASDLKNGKFAVPVLPLDDIARIADFIEQAVIQAHQPPE